MSEWSSEYVCVQKATRQYPLLRRAFFTPMTQTAARALLRLLQWRYGVIQPLAIRFRKGVGGTAEWHPGENRFEVELPATPYSGKGDSCEELTAGLVLHEFTHVLQKCQKRHDATFTRMLDMLLVQTQGVWDGAYVCQSS